MSRFAQIRLIANHTYKSIVKTPINRWLVGAFIILIVIALSSSFLDNYHHNHEVEHYSNEIKDRWDNNPDKHPHRMAHYGYVAFRNKFPLSFFDGGLDSYLGNVVFLEAHRQNSVNFSQASLSNGLLRFGKLSAGLLLQLLLPLLIFFWGYNLVSKEREQGVLKMYLSQGVVWSEIILGKTLGLFTASMIIVAPTFLLTILLLLFSSSTVPTFQLLLSFSLLLVSFLTYLLTICFITVWISARSSSSKFALIKLIGFWIAFTLVLPKLFQVAGQVIHPSPSKIEFDTLVESEILKQGDSHNPEDPHFKGIKDSLLAEYKVASTKELPFNYSGYIMKEGEKLSTMTFRAHQDKLVQTYHKQNNMVNMFSLVNPYIAIKHVSMALSGTDFESYQIFKNATEDYRYNLAQTMNELQIKHISNTVASSADKGAVISAQYWRDFVKFEQRFLSFKEMLSSIILSLVALISWLIAFVLASFYFTKKLKAI